MICLCVLKKKMRTASVLGQCLFVNTELSHLTKWCFVHLFHLINSCLVTQREWTPLRIIPPQDQHTLPRNTTKQRSKRRGQEGCIQTQESVSEKRSRDESAESHSSLCNSSCCRDCFSTFWGENIQTDLRGDSAVRLKDLLIVLVLLDLISHNGDKHCCGTVLQVDYSLGWLQFVRLIQYNRHLKARKTWIDRRWWQNDKPESFTAIVLALVFSNLPDSTAQPSKQNCDVRKKCSFRKSTPDSICSIRPEWCLVLLRLSDSVLVFGWSVHEAGRMWKWQKL